MDFCADLGRYDSIRTSLSCVGIAQYRRAPCSSIENLARIGCNLRYRYPNAIISLSLRLMFDNIINRQPEAALRRRCSTGRRGRDGARKKEVERE